MTELFPLPLAPFEEYLFRDDRPGYRMTIGVELEFEGELCRESFAAGAKLALQRHPLLRSRVEQRWFRKPRWIPVDNAQPVIDWGPLDQPVELPVDEGIDLTAEIGIRFFVRVGENRSRMIILVHHVCCDGVGLLQFLSDLFAAYARCLDPHAPQPPGFQPVNPAQLRKRDNLWVVFHKPISWLRFAAKATYDSVKIICHAPAPLTAPARPQRTAATLSLFGTLTTTLDASVLPRLKKRARREGVSINDILVWQLFLVLRDWNAAHASASKSPWLTVVVPNNMRNHELDGMPAANVVTYTFFHRHLRELDAPAALLRSLHDLGEYCLNWRYSTLFLNGLRWIRQIPGFLSSVLRLPLCTGTAVLSYLGNPARVVAGHFPVNADGNPVIGNVALTDLSAAPPIRPLTRASFMAWHFDDKLRLGVKCDPLVFDRDAAQELVDLFAERVVALSQAQTAENARRPAAA